MEVLKIILQLLVALHTPIALFTLSMAVLGHHDLYREPTNAALAIIVSWIYGLIIFFIYKDYEGDFK